jgi:hypothetical protein
MRQIGGRWRFAKLRATFIIEKIPNPKFDAQTYLGE